MPILAVDENGRIYQTSPDRADGLGFGARPERVGRGDVTLGNAYLNSECEYRAKVMNEKRSLAIEELKDQKIQREQRAVLAEKRRKAMAQEELERDELYQRNRIRQAVSQLGRGPMGCGCPSTPLSGDGRTANGQLGFAGMSRDQQAIHHALTGMGRSAAHPVDPVEARQKQLEQKAKNVIAFEAAQTRGADFGRAPARIAHGQRPVGSIVVPREHPLARHFKKASW